MRKFNLKYAPVIVSISVALNAFAAIGVAAFSPDEMVALPEELASDVSERKTLSNQLFDGCWATLKNHGEGADDENSSDLEPGADGQASKKANAFPLVTKLDRSVGIEIQEKHEEETRKAEEERNALEQAKKAEKSRKSKSKPSRSGPPSISSNAARVSNSSVGRAAFNAASSCIGLLYGASKGEINLDCSGLVAYAYGQVGVALPHSAKAQYAACQKISANSLQVGDLVFWASGANVNHVGIYAGNGQVLEASVSGKPIAIRKIWSGSRQTVIGYGRP